MITFLMILIINHCTCDAIHVLIVVVIVIILYYNCVAIEEKPGNWDPMPSNSSGKEVHVHMVILLPTSEEYLEAEKKFNVTMAKGKTYNKIHSIQRLQNPILYGQYIARKKEMDRRNPTGHENEKWLFHGTSPSVLDNINTQGFNRIFKGKNGQ